MAGPYRNSDFKVNTYFKRFPDQLEAARKSVIFTFIGQENEENRFCRASSPQSFFKMSKMLMVTSPIDYLRRALSNLETSLLSPFLLWEGLTVVLLPSRASQIFLADFSSLTLNFVVIVEVAISIPPFYIHILSCSLRKMLVLPMTIFMEMMRVFRWLNRSGLSFN